ncbi:hypothetical protein [Streptomyces sp. NPDC093097]|uniref:hypothetical protein n=1 Tax=Streptomyces sp. NPDC093097 TaxID=3366027 RepID=UPI00382D0341
MPRHPKKPRRLVAGRRAYLWTLRHSHQVMDSRRPADCRQTLTPYPQSTDAGGPLRIVFAQSRPVHFLRAAHRELSTPGSRQPDPYAVSDGLMTTSLPR